MKRVLTLILSAALLLCACNTPRDTDVLPSKTEQWNEAIGGFADFFIPVRTAFGEWLWDSGVSHETLDLQNVSVMGSTALFPSSLHAEWDTQTNDSQSVRSIALSVNGKQLRFEQFSDSNGAVLCLPELFEGEYFTNGNTNGLQGMQNKLIHAFHKHVALEELLCAEERENGVLFSFSLVGEPLQSLLADMRDIMESSGLAELFSAYDSEISGLQAVPDRLSAVLQTDTDKRPVSLELTWFGGTEALGSFLLAASETERGGSLRATFTHGSLTASLETEYTVSGERLRFKSTAAFGSLSVSADITVHQETAAEKTYVGTLLLRLEADGAAVAVPIALSATSEKNGNGYAQTVSMSARAAELLTFEFIYEGTHALSLPALHIPAATDTFDTEKTQALAEFDPALYRLFAFFLMANV